MNGRDFRASQVQRVEGPVTRALKSPGEADNVLVHFDYFGRERQEGSILQPPFQVRISVDLISQRFAGNLLNRAIPGMSKDTFNAVSFLPDSRLGFIVGDAINTPSVDADLPP